MTHRLSECNERVKATTAAPDVFENFFPASRRRHGRLLTVGLAASIALHLVAMILLPGFAHPHSLPSQQPLEVVLLEPKPPPTRAVEPETAPERKRPEARPPGPHKQAAPHGKPVEKPQPESAAAPPAPMSVPQSEPNAAAQAQPTPESASPTASRPAPAQSDRSVATAAPAAPSPPSFDAAYLQNPRPAYPRTARRNHEQGAVMLRVLVTRDGLAAHVEIDRSSGSASLDAAATAAVERWHFVPAHRGAEPAEAWVRVPIEFRLEDAL